MSEFQIIKDINMELGSFKFSNNKNVIIIIILYTVYLYKDLSFVCPYKN